ncbi:MAG: zf-TFIIB domain-containing protein [Candidatus Omnitrophota bacterium]
MNCPKCVGKLEKKEIEGIEIDACFVCEGIWFDAGELEEVVKRDSKDVAYIDVGREEFDGGELKALKEELDAKTGKCPRCEDGTLLAKKEYQGKHTINVDVCPKGHGIWLDGGEIQELRKRGLVNLKDQLGNLKDFLGYAFSKDGLRDLFRGRRNQPPS